MTMYALHGTNPVRSAASKKIVRLVVTVLILAAVAVGVVALRYAMYAHFHGDDRALRGVAESLGQIFN